MENNIIGKNINKVSISDMVKNLKETLTMHRDIVLVFIFGSFVRGDVTSFSDLDIAIYFTDTIDFYRISDLREDISEMLGIEVGFMPDKDVVLAKVAAIQI